MRLATLSAIRRTDTEAYARPECGQPQTGSGSLLRQMIQLWADSGLLALHFRSAQLGGYFSAAARSADYKA